MKKCEKHAGRSQVGHVWALIKSWSVWLWEDCGVGTEKGKNGNALKINKGRENARVKYSSPSPAGTSCLQREGAGGVGGTSAKKTLPSVSEFSSFSQPWVNKREKRWTTRCQSCSKTVKENWKSSHLHRPLFRLRPEGFDDGGNEILVEDCCSGCVGWWNIAAS